MLHQLSPRLAFGWHRDIAVSGLQTQIDTVIDNPGGDGVEIVSDLSALEALVGTDFCADCFGDWCSLMQSMSATGLWAGIETAIAGLQTQLIRSSTIRAL